MVSMKIILTQDIEGKGKKGDLIEVSPGYARNYLLPRNLAQVADEAAIADYENREQSRLYHEEQAQKQAQVVADKIEGKTVKLTAKVGEEGKLFGSVTSKDVADQINKQYKVEVDRRKIEMEDIKATGNYPVEIKLAPEVVANIVVAVDAE